MLIKLSTDKTVSETAAALQAAVQANHFGVMQVHNLKETMIKKGVEFAVNVCQRPPVPSRRLRRMAAAADTQKLQVK